MNTAPFLDLNRIFRVLRTTFAEVGVWTLEVLSLLGVGCQARLRR